CLGVRKRLRTSGRRLSGSGFGGETTRDAHAGAPRYGTCGVRRELLELDAPAGLLQLGLELVGLFALDPLADGLGGLVHERLGLLEAEAGRRADDLDDLDLLVARGGQDDIDGARLLLGGGAVT